MIKETYLGVIGKKLKEYPDARFYIVMRSLPKWAKDMVEKDDRVEYLPILSPSKKLFMDYKYNGLPWDEYVPIFLHEMESIDTQEKMRAIVEESKTNIVFLVCVEKTTKFCHRFLLLDLMRKLDN